MIAAVVANLNVLALGHSHHMECMAIEAAQRKGPEAILKYMLELAASTEKFARRL